jgi:hypothetical protein
MKSNEVWDSRGRTNDKHWCVGLTAADVCCLHSFICSVKSTAVKAPDRMVEVS